MSTERRQTASQLRLKNHHQRDCPKNPCARRRLPTADRAPEFSPVARAAQDYAPTFSRNQFPDQTQSPWDHYRTLLRAHTVVEKNQPLPTLRPHSAARAASSADYLAYA